MTFDDPNTSFHLYMNDQQQGTFGSRSEAVNAAVLTAQLFPRATIEVLEETTTIQRLWSNVS